MYSLITKIFSINPLMSIKAKNYFLFTIRLIVKIGVRSPPPPLLVERAFSAAPDWSSVHDLPPYCWYLISFSVIQSRNSHSACKSALFCCRVQSEPQQSSVKITPFSEEILKYFSFRARPRPLEVIRREREKSHGVWLKSPPFWTPPRQCLFIWQPRTPPGIRDSCRAQRRRIDPSTPEDLRVRV